MSHPNATFDETNPDPVEGSNSSMTSCSWAYDEADEIAFVKAEEQNCAVDKDARSSYRRVFSTKHYRQRHVPNVMFYPFALAAW